MEIKFIQKNKHRKAFHSALPSFEAFFSIKVSVAVGPTQRHLQANGKLKPSKRKKQWLHKRRCQREPIRAAESENKSNVFEIKHFISRFLHKAGKTTTHKIYTTFKTFDITVTSQSCEEPHARRQDVWRSHVTCDVLEWFRGIIWTHWWCRRIKNILTRDPSPLWRWHVWDLRARRTRPHVLRFQAAADHVINTSVFRQHRGEGFLFRWLFQLIGCYNQTKLEVLVPTPCHFLFCRNSKRCEWTPWQRSRLHHRWWLHYWKDAGRASFLSVNKCYTM